MMLNFFELTPEQIVALDLTIYSNAELRELAYYIWTMHPHNVGLMDWRKTRLLPLLMIDDLVYDED